MAPSARFAKTNRAGGLAGPAGVVRSRRPYLRLFFLDAFFAVFLAAFLAAFFFLAMGGSLVVTREVSERTEARVTRPLLTY